MSNKKSNIYLEQSDIKVKFRYTKEEYVKSRRKFLLESKAISKGNISFLIFMTFFEILLLLMREKFFSIINGVLLVISYILIILLYYVQPIKVYNKTKMLKEEMELEFNDKGVKIKLNNDYSIILWDNICEIWESKDYIFLMQSKISYILILKRAFRNKADIVKIQRIYENNNGKYKNIK